METICVHKSNTMKRVVFGLVVITAGVLWMFRNTGLMDDATASLVFSWPVLIMAIGLIGLFGDSKVFAVILLAVGGFYFAGRLYDIPIEFRQVFWPSLIIVAGLLILLKAGHVFRHRRLDRLTRSNDILDEVNIFGGGEVKVLSKEFKGGKITAVFGGSNVNLLDCELAEGDQTLEISAVFGGFKIFVPSHWNVKVEMANVFGGVVDKRQISPDTDMSRTLVIKGSAVFGGGEITSML